MTIKTAISSFLSLFACISLALAFVSGGSVLQTNAALAGGLSNGQSCGGPASIKCAKGYWCDPKPGTCSTKRALGKCVRNRPGGACPRIYRPECGCDGKTYGNSCTRRNAFVGKRHNGRCG